jgi:hypothetical protein
MANSQALCTSFKAEILSGLHALGTSVVRGSTAADTVKAALYTTAGSLGAGTTAYSTTNEVTNGSGSGYTAGGAVVTNATPPSSSGTTAFWTPSASVSWTSFTSAAAFDAMLLYNASQSNRAISVHTFGSQTVTAGTFTLTMPTNDASTGLIRAV